MAEELDSNLGIDRRTLIKRGAIVGGAVWAAPAITSVGSRAFGQTTTGTPAETNISYILFNALCGSTTYRVKVEEDGTCEAGNTFSAPDCADVSAGTATDAENAAFCAGTVTTVNADGTVTVDLPDGCSFTGAARVKCGQCCETRSPTGNSSTFAECSAVQPPCA